MQVDVCFGTDIEYCVHLLDTDLPNSAIEGGLSYTVRFSVVASDILSGKDVQFRSNLLHTDTRFLEFCVAINCRIL